MSRQFASASSQSLNAGSAPASAPPFTMACWCLQDSSAIMTMMSIGDTTSATDFFKIIMTDSSLGHEVWAQERFSAGFRTAQSTAGASGTGELVHACGVFETTSLRHAYFNGANKGTLNSAGGAGSANDLYIGAEAKSSPAIFMNGRVAEAAVWNAVLTDTEVAILGLGVSPLFVRPASLVFYSPLIRAEDRDVVGGLTLTANNSPTVSVHPPIIRPSAQIMQFPPAGAAPATTIPVFMHQYRQRRII